MASIDHIKCRCCGFLKHGSDFSHSQYVRKSNDNMCCKNCAKHVCKRKDNMCPTEAYLNASAQSFVASRLTRPSAKPSPPPEPPHYVRLSREAYDWVTEQVSEFRNRGFVPDIWQMQQWEKEADKLYPNKTPAPAPTPTYRAPASVTLTQPTRSCSRCYLAIPSFNTWYELCGKFYCGLCFCHWCSRPYPPSNSHVWLCPRENCKIGYSNCATCDRSVETADLHESCGKFYCDNCYCTV